MSAVNLFAAAGVALIGLGFAGVLLQRHLLRKLLAFNILTSGVFLLLVALAQRAGRVDPLPHALVLTGIVVAIAATAIVLVLVRRWYRLSGQVTLDPDAPNSKPTPTPSDQSPQP